VRRRPKYSISIRNRLADFAPAGEVPFVWEIVALARFYGLHGAITPVEEDAFAVGLFDERESVAVLAQAGVLLDEIALGDAEERGERSDLGLVDLYEARPAAAVRAALALVIDLLTQAPPSRRRP